MNGPQFPFRCEDALALFYVLEAVSLNLWICDVKKASNSPEIET